MKAGLAAGVALVLASATTATGWRAAAHDPITTKVTWSKEISRIALRRCVGCHAPGGPAPMPLTTYEAARPWARAIKHQVVARRMPPWSAARGFGDFENDPTLSPFEIALIAAWADGGAPRGDTRDLPAGGRVSPVPARPVPPPGRPVPTLSFLLPRRHEAPRGQRVTAVVDAGLTRDRWITGWEVNPRDAAIVRADFSIAGGAWLGSWVPPERDVSLPAGAGRRLPAGSSVEVAIEYRAARLQADFPVEAPVEPPELRLFISARPPAREARALEVPCGVTPIRERLEVFAVRPAAARTGSDIGVVLTSPNGPPAALAWIRDFNPDYRPTYRLRALRAMAPGSRLEITSADSSCRVTIEYLSR